MFCLNYILEINLNTMAARFKFASVTMYSSISVRSTESELKIEERFSAEMQKSIVNSRKATLEGDTSSLEAILVRVGI